MMRRSLSTLAAAALALAASPLVTVVPAHAASGTFTCAQLDAALAAAVDGDVITLHDSSLCTGTHTLKAGVHITLQGQSAMDGFDGTGTTGSLLTGHDVGNTVIRNLIFQNGTASVAEGGAIMIYGNVSPTISNNSFFHNTSDEGGAIEIPTTGTTGVVTITHNVFGAAGRGNFTTSGGAGGGLLVMSQINMVITDNVFEANSAGYGGGVALSDPTGAAVDIDFERNRVLNNHLLGAGDGAGAGIVTTGNITLVDNTFSGNTIPAGSRTAPNLGGGLQAATAGAGHAITQSHNIFSGNSIGTQVNNSQTAFDYGGGGEFALSPMVNSLDDTFVNNSVGDAGANTTPVGGGFAIQGNQGTKTTLNARNLVVANNAVGRDGEGGGVYAGLAAAFNCQAPPCTAEIDLFDSTVVANAVGPAGTGPGLGGSATDTARVVNSIVYGNTGNARQVGGFGTTSINHSDSCAAAATADAGAGNVCVDPKLVNVGGNDVHEQASSPTVDAGDTAQVPAGLVADYEGQGRVQGARVDMGADELTPAVVPTPTLPKAGAGPSSAPFQAGLVPVLAVCLVGAMAVWRRRRGLPR